MTGGSGVESALARDLQLLEGWSTECHKYGQKEAKPREEKDPHTGHQNIMSGETVQIWVLKEFTKKSEAES